MSLMLLDFSYCLFGYPNWVLPGRPVAPVCVTRGNITWEEAQKGDR